MKKLALTIGLLAGATAGYSQGIINWTDYIKNSYYIEVFGGGTGGPGNTVNDLPSGSATYTGTPLGNTGAGNGPTGYGNGAHYTIGLYAATTTGALATQEASGTPIATDNFTAGSGGWDFSSGLNQNMGVPSGTTLDVQLAVWYNGFGATTYGAAVTEAQGADPTETLGLSSIGSIQANGPPATPNTLAAGGIQDFIIAGATPEPSTIALGVIGASAFLMRLRRKQ